MSDITAYESACTELCRLLALSADKGALRKAVFSKSQDKSIIKAVASPISVGGSACIQVEFFHTDNKATHKNIVLDENTASAILKIVRREGFFLPLSTFAKKLWEKLAVFASSS
jgi:hypothetical protein